MTDEGEPIAQPRIPASTRIITEITEIEKVDKVLGQRLTAMLFEFKLWVEQQCERRHRGGQ